MPLGVQQLGPFHSREWSGTGTGGPVPAGIRKPAEFSRRSGEPWGPPDRHQRWPPSLLPRAWTEGYRRPPCRVHGSRSRSCQLKMWVWMMPSIAAFLSPATSTLPLASWMYLAQKMFVAHHVLRANVLLVGFHTMRACCCGSNTTLAGRHPLNPDQHFPVGQHCLENRHDAGAHH